MTPALRIAAAALVIAIAAVTAAHAQPERDGAAGFRDASALLGAGDLEGAQAAFEQIADADPAGDWADDALAEAAGIAERRGDLASGLRLWRRLAADHPSSRASRRARARITALDRALGAQGQWLTIAEQHEALLRDASATSDPTPQVHALAALIAGNPEYPRAAEARLWIGDSWLRLARVDDAIATFREARIRAGTDAERWRASKALADALALGDGLDEAEQIYRGLLGTSDELSDLALHEALRDLDTFRTRQRLITAAWLVLGIGLLLVGVITWRAAGGIGPAARGLLRPPIEVGYFLPVALVLGAVSLTGNLLVAQAVQTILLGGLAVTWLGGASLRAAQRAGKLGLPLLIAQLVWISASVLAVCYLAVMNDRLIDMLAETWQHGPEGR